MKVSELIAQLQTMPQDAMVVINGYDGGVDELDAPLHAVEIALNANSQYGRYLGRHEVLEDDYDRNKYPVDEYTHAQAVKL
jgi:hypothetical protein